MKNKRILTVLLAVTLLAGAFSCAGAEWQEEIKNNKVARRIWVDRNGEKDFAPEGYAEVTYTYTGTSVTERYYDPDGNPVKTSGGFYARVLTYGNKHRLEEIVYLDEDGTRTLCTGGYTRVKMGYTAAGGVTFVTYYDMANELVLVPSLGYAQMKSDYRGTTLTKTSYFDENKNLIDTPMGYAVMVQSVNKSNKVTGIRFEHADGTDAACAEGWASMKRELDKKNREVSLKYYDLSGKMTDRGLGYAYEVKSWEGDQVYTASRYDLQNQRIPMGAGYTSVRRELDKEGRVIRETYLDETGSPRENTDGVTARKYEYDANGRLKSVRFETARGEAAENTAGYAGYRETLDTDGFVLSRVFLGKGGSPANTTAGYSEIRYLYDANKKVRRTEYYDVNGSLVKAE